MPTFADDIPQAHRGRAHPPRFEPLDAPLPDDVPAACLHASGDITPAALAFWLTRLQAAQAGADRATSPDLFGQLQRIPEAPVDTLVCSALDESELLRPNAALAARHPHAVAAGIELLGHLAGVKRMWMVADSCTPDHWYLLTRKIIRHVGARWFSLDGAYPQADPTLLIHRLTGRHLRPGRLPPEVGILLLDAAAAAAVGHAVAGRVNEQHPCAIYDHVAQTAHYLSIHHGRGLGHILADAGIHASATVLMSGHPLRNRRCDGHAHHDGRALTYHAAAPQPPVNSHVCIRCGWCADVCPTRIHPARILEANQMDNRGLGEKSGIHACIECGLCTAVCPSQLPLMVGIREMKRKL